MIMFLNGTIGPIFCLHKIALGSRSSEFGRKNKSTINFYIYIYMFSNSRTMINRHLKNTTYLLAIGLTFLLSSCGDKKNECENVELTGRWEMSASSTEIFLNGSSFVDYLIENMDYSLDSAIYASAYPDIFWSIEFNSDNTYNQTYLGQQYSGTWSFEDNGNSILLDEGQQYEINMQVISLSKDALLVTYRESGGLIDYNEDGDPETLEFVYTHAFERNN